MKLGGAPYSERQIVRTHFSGAPELRLKIVPVTRKGVTTELLQNDVHLLQEQKTDIQIFAGVGMPRFQLISPSNTETTFTIHIEDMSHD